MNIIDEIKHDIAGARILKDWWGDGLSHVSQEKADHRSLSCVRGDSGKPCKHNSHPNYWEKHFKDPIAQEIIKQIEIKEKLKLETPFDDFLHLCDVCGCCLKTSIWTPIKHISAHTSHEVFSKYPQWCWKKNELSGKFEL